MKLRFSKMHGAGNDFVVLDGVRQSIMLTKAQWRFIADRRFGIGADQMLLIEAAKSPNIDFNYRIFNADGGEVEHCGNGARCFVRFVNDQGLSTKPTLRVQTMNGVLTLDRVNEQMVQVNMGKPIFNLPQIPFDSSNLTSLAQGSATVWQLPLANDTQAQLSVVSMGNPHAVQIVESAANTPVAILGAAIGSNARFADGVNVGFMQILDRQRAIVRVFERGAGETLACGSGVCAAVVAGIGRGLLDQHVVVSTRGGTLTVDWDGSGDVLLTGPTQNVFTGEIDVPDHPEKFHEQPLPTA